MGYRSLQACVADLEASKRLVRVDAPVDPYLEVAEIQRRVYQAGGPAILFTQAQAARFRCSATCSVRSSAMRYMFRDTLDDVHGLIALKVDPGRIRPPALAISRRRSCRAACLAASRLAWSGARA